MRSGRGWSGLGALIAVALTSLGPGGATAGQMSADLVLIVGVNHHLRDPGHRFHHADDGALLAARVMALTSPSARIQVLATPDDPDTKDGFEQAGIDPLPPTRADIELAMRDFSRAAHAARSNGRKIRLFLYFSGFADPGGVLHLEDDALDMDTLISMLEQVGPDQAFALLDVVHPSRVAPDARTPVAPPPLIPAADELARRPGWLGYLGATSTDIQANNTQGGLLTAVGLTGLAGAADLDGDRRITFFEWRQFVRMQIDLDKPFAPLLRAVAPRGDPLATVVDLHTVIASRLVVDGTVPNGIMEIRQESGGGLLGQWYHHQGFQDRICVPSGHLEVRRYSDRTPRRVQGAGGQILYVANRVYPVERARISVGPGEVVGYDLDTRTTLVYLIPEDRGSGGAFPEGSQVEALSPDEEVRLIGLLFRTTREPGLELPPSAWYLGARAALPAPVQIDFASGLTANTSSALPLLNGGALRMARTLPRALHNRWFMARVFFFEYGQYEVRDASLVDLDGNTYTLETARAHQFRLGPGLRQTHLGTMVRWDLEESLSYGPLWVVGGGTEAGGQAGLGFLSLSEVILEASAALMVPLGRAMELGAVAGIQVSLFHENRVGSVQLQPTLGLVMRPKVIRE